MKKIISLVMVLAMLVGVLAGCGGGSSDVSLTEDPNVCPEDAYEINWYLMADPQTDVHSVEEKVNEYLKDKINATVKITCLSSAQYKQKMGTMINANEYFDLCFVSRWMLDYVNNSRSGAFCALNDYFDTYLKDIISEYSQEVIDCSSVDGTLYALPVNKEMATQYGWVYRKDLADKYGIDMTQYKSFEELEPVLKLIKENEPDIKYPMDWSSDTAPERLYVYEKFIYKDGTYPDDHTVNVYETPKFKKACETARDFYEKGYVRPDVLTATDMLQRMQSGKTFVILQSLKPGKAKELFKESAYEFEQAEVTEPIIDYLAGTGSMQAISSTSKNPARVARFLNLLNTDPYLKNLIVHGIEGKHYKKIDENTVEPIPNSGYDLYSVSWAIGNVFLDYLTPSEEPDKLARLKEFNDSAKTAKVNKFILPENDERDRKLSEISKVAAKYKNQLIMGVVDPDTTLPEFISALDDVGIDDMLEEIQTEYEAYLKTLK